MARAEEHNLKEEIKDSIASALRNGVFNDNCAVFKVMRKEQFSPRGKAMIIDNGFYEKIIYKCNLCKACDNTISNTKLCDAFQKARQVLVLQKKELGVNKKMIENLRKSGNIYGFMEDN